MLPSLPPPSSSSSCVLIPSFASLSFPELRCVSSRICKEGRCRPLKNLANRYFCKGKRSVWWGEGYLCLCVRVFSAGEFFFYCFLLRILFIFYENCLQRRHSLLPRFVLVSHPFFSSSASSPSPPPCKRLTQPSPEEASPDNPCDRRLNSLLATKATVFSSGVPGSLNHSLGIFLESFPRSAILSSTPDPSPPCSSQSPTASSPA